MKLLLPALFLSLALPLFSGGPAVNSGKTEVLEGHLVRLAKPSGTASHCIVLIVNRKRYPLAYAGSSKRDLTLWEDRTVRIEGRTTWMSGSKIPCIEIDRITPVK